MFQMRFEPVVIPLIIQAILLSALGLYALRRRQVTLARTFAILMASLTLWTVSYALGLMSVTLEGKIFWQRLKYLGAGTMPVIWFILCLQYVRLQRVLTRPLRIVLWGFAALTILIVITSNFHGWMWQSVWIEPGILEEEVSHGWFFWVYQVVTMLSIMVSTVLFTRFLFKAPLIYRNQALAMTLGSVLPLGWRLGTVIFGWDFIPQLDDVIVSFSIAALAFAWAILGNSLLDLVPIARETVVDLLNDPVVILDLHGRIVDVNPAAAKDVGMSESDMVGKHALDIVREDERQLVFDLAQEQDLHMDVVLRNRHYDLQVAMLRQTPNGRPFGRVMRLHDMTEVLKLIEELDAYAHTVAHDLKNPVSILLGFSDLLSSDEGLSPEDTRMAAEKIKEASLKMDTIINELLLLASIRKKDDIETQPLDMAAVIAEAQSRLVTVIAEKQAEIIVQPEMPAALGYAPWVEEIWANYISNALKYGGDPPRIEIGADKQEPGRIHFWVKDNGRGLSQAEQDALFTEFTRLDTVRAQGHGLGLSVVKRIAARLNGDVGVESDGEQGSTFYFTLPVAL